jgi:ATP-binding cassette, subfamily G (WHITE), member 1
VSGEFRGGELTGIVGQSGSGKTSLINCLSSFVTKNVSGSIAISSSAQSEGHESIKVKYIMQEDVNYSNLTVFEAMIFSMRFKTGFMDEKRQNEKIICILNRLGISHTMNHFIRNLSTGEHKRLSIGLELLDDPKVIFLDEPTSGLDHVSATQCIKLLKKLATEGHTVVCTIHQPSSLILKMFDHLYAMSEGFCIYQGSNEQLVPFLQRNKLCCPCSYNPVDYLLEISNGGDISFLVKQIENGKNEEFSRYNNNNNNDVEMMIDDGHKSNNNKKPAAVDTRTPSFSYRLWQLTRRNLLLIARDKSNLIMRLSIHLVVGMMIGILYRGIGNDANEILNEFKFIFILNGFIAYSGFYSLMTKREIFSSWEIF